MKTPKFSRYYLLLCLPVLLALVGLVWGRPAGGGKAKFDQDDFKGRYVSAEAAYVTFTVDKIGEDNEISAPQLVGTTAVMISDGKGNVCGQRDGFVSGIGGPGYNYSSGPPAYYYGTYQIDANGRITIDYCWDNGFCAHSGACAPKDVFWEEVGYLQSTDANTVTTVEQAIEGVEPSYAVVHPKVWTRAASEHNHY